MEYRVSDSVNNRTSVFLNRYSGSIACHQETQTVHVQQKQRLYFFVITF